MKIKVIFSCLLISALILSCKKKDEAVVTPITTYHISRDSAYDSNPVQTLVRLYSYNSNKQFLKVNTKNGTSSTYDGYDTVYYNSNNQVSKVERYVTGIPVPSSTNTYNYTANILTSVNESGSNSNGSYVRTRTYTYTAGKVSSQAVVYTAGSGTGGPENINSITFSSNNISSLDIVGVGLASLTTDYSATNPYYGINFSLEEFLDIFNPNNVLKAFETANPANIFLDNTYTYTNGRVTKIVNAAQSNRTTDIEYIAL